ncbi:MAG: FHA domain-containing protein [Anaerolineae bacterium]|nr:FHA domain-containing protein [Anaerolineae bacterium]
MMKSYQLSICSGEGEWKQIDLLPGVHVIGRAPDCQIVLPSTEVSRHHAQIEISESGCFLMDLGSVNGTQLKGSPLQPRRKVILEPGQVFLISSFQFKINLVEAKAGFAEGTAVSVAEQPKTVIGVLPPAVAAPGQSVQLVLRYRRGEGPWQTYTLVEGEQFIGRVPTNQIALDASCVSRCHAKVVLKDGRVTITDLGSKNGVLYHGQLIPPNQPVLLNLLDSFRIDEFTFELAAGAQLSGLNIDRDSSTVLEVDASRLASEPIPTGRLNLLGQDRVTIGRAPDNQIVLDHPMVSRYHAVIERLGTRSRIVNTHSANGLYVNGQLVEGTTWLNPGDNIKIGPYQMQFTGNELHRSTAESYAIDVIGLNKYVSKDLNLLKDISLSVGQNEFVALVGMSGAGKSTLMDAINGFRPATSGQVLVNGVDLYKNYEMFRDDIGNVPQRDIVHMELTPEQALNYAAQLRMPADTSAQERAAAINSTLNDLGLTFKKDVPISRLSGGQLKRVSIGVELLTKPRLFFLDEPTSGLDPGTEYEMMKLLRHLADQGRTVLIITHATKNVMFCDKAIILAKGGNLAFYGPPELALEYFDQYRTHRERLEKDMEFDDIYRILTDEKRGKPEEWRQRYLQSEYARYIRPQFTQAPAGQAFVGSNRKRKRISAFKQFFILSARQIRCMVQDRASLGLTLALAPLLGLMNFIWGSKLSDPVEGDATKIMAMWYMVAVIALLVGSMGSMREIVKELDIYKRERAVGLKIFPYVLSKAWIGAALSLYQGTAILFFVIILTKPFVRHLDGYFGLWVTIILTITCGYLLGLVVSALSPNQNSAQTILIGVLVPQLLFVGLLLPLDKIPGGNIISLGIGTRWAYESFVKSTGIGDKLIADPCWNLPAEERNALTPTQKEGCLCMGPNIFKNCRDFPGILSSDFYDEDAKVALAQDEPKRPLEPTWLPSPTPRNTPTQLPTPTLLATPTLFPTPTSYPTPTRLPVSIGGSPERRSTDYAGLSPEDAAEKAQNEAYWRANKYQSDTEKQFEEYRLTREAQFNDYQNQTRSQLEEYKKQVEGQFDAYQQDVRVQVENHINSEIDSMEIYKEDVKQQFTGYQEEMEDYGETYSDWTRNRQEAIGAAETILGIVYDDYGRSFHGSVIARWIYILIITFAQFVLVLILQKRKDAI